MASVFGRWLIHEDTMRYLAALLILVSAAVAQTSKNLSLTVWNTTVEAAERFKIASVQSNTDGTTKAIAYPHVALAVTYAPDILSMGYQIYRKGTTDPDYSKLAYTNRLNYDDYSIKPGERYSYRVSRVAMDGAEKDPSNVVDVQINNWTIEQPPSPLAQPARHCTAEYSRTCNLRLDSVPQIGQHVLIVASSLYKNANLTIPAGFQTDFFANATFEQVLASKYVASAADQVRDYSVTTSDPSYYRCVVFVINDLAPSAWFDTKSQVIDQRDAKSYTASLSVGMLDRVFSITQAWNQPLIPDPTWEIVDSVTGVQNDNLLIQTTKVYSAGTASVTQTTNQPTALIGFATGYKTK